MALPCFWISHKCRPTTRRKTAGKTTTCRAKKRCKVIEADVRAAAEQIGKEGSNQRHGFGNSQAHLGGEECQLVPGQQVAAEAQEHGHKEQDQAAPPGNLTGAAVGLHQGGREHVNHDGQDHQVGCPGMGGADQPAEVDLVGDLADRLVGLGTGPEIDQQQDPGQALDNEEEERNAAPVIPERVAVLRDHFLGGEVPKLPFKPSLSSAHWKKRPG